VEHEVDLGRALAPEEQRARLATQAERAVISPSARWWHVRQARAMFSIGLRTWWSLTLMAPSPR